MHNFRVGIQVDGIYRSGNDVLYCTYPFFYSEVKGEFRSLHYLLDTGTSHIMRSLDEILFSQAVVCITVLLLRKELEDGVFLMATS